jgi:hypothetical protein
MRRRIVFVPMSIEATLLREVGADFTAELLRDDVCRQFRLKDLEGGPVVQVIRLERGSGDNPKEKLVMGFTGNGIDGKVEAIQIFFIIVF